jgi:hypothetical protein
LNGIRFLAGVNQIAELIMIVLTPDALLNEIRGILENRLPVALAMTKGALLGEGLENKMGLGLRDRRWSWILQAHVGTLQKLPNLLPSDRTPTTAELLVIARNLFENIVWLRLFETNPEEGVTFYAQLLKDQKQDVERTIGKVLAEADLFDSVSAEDLAIVNDVYSKVGQSGLPPTEDIDALNTEHRRRHAQLDARVRREFTLYSAAARINGYGWQAEIIRKKDVPQRQAHLAKIEVLIVDFEAYVDDPARLAQARRRWNWRAECAKVGMVDQYDFLYAWTSRLLHSTPMNIITEKELLDPEQTMLLEYVAVAIEAVIGCIEDFAFPGRHRIMAVDAGDEVFE